MALTDNLISYYKLDESSGTAADSVGGFNLPVVNVTYSTGKINNGANLNGSNSVINSTTNGTSGYQSPATGDASISCWIKLANNTQNPTIIAGFFGNTYYGQYGRGLSYENGTVKAWGTANNTHAALSAALTDTTSWHHLVCVGAASGSLWIDGTQVATGNISDTWTFYFGIGATTWAGNIDFFNGSIDEVGLWSRTLTSGEIATLYNGGAGLQYPFTSTVNSGAGFFALAN